jgi:hypothetical protein
MVAKLPEFVVPEEASKRGRILKVDLRSPDFRIPEVLGQLSKMSPHIKETTIFLYPSLEQAKTLLDTRSPLSLEGVIRLDECTTEIYSSNEIWLKYGSQFTDRKIRCFTHCSGRLADLKITSVVQGLPQGSEVGSAWFVANGCYALQLLATPAEDEQLIATRHKIERQPHRFELSGGAVAEISRITARQSRKGEKETKKRAYAIQVESIKSAEKVNQDVSGLLILASLISRERSDFGYWSVKEAGKPNIQNWRFGYSKWPKRPNGVEPLLRGEGNCRDFLSCALKHYQAASDTSSLDSAVYALLARDLPIESNIVNLYTATQRILTFALSLPTSNKMSISKLWAQFEKKYTIDLQDLWPLFGSKGSASLNEIRNVLVHGRAFTAASDFKALSIATENLRWTLERILLAILGWDIELSTVSAKKLNWLTAHNWKEPQKSLTL